MGLYSYVQGILHMAVVFILTNYSKTWPSCVSMQTLKCSNYKLRIQSNTDCDFRGRSHYIFLWYT